MLPQKRRINRSEIDYILKNSRRYNSPHLTLYLSRNPENMDSDTKFSFSVSKKVCKGAVDRNKLRRRGYSIISKSVKNPKKGFLCFFLYKKDSDSLDFTAIESELKRLLSDSGVLI